MYNRYIPQPDGTYRRSQRQDTPQKPQMQQHTHPHSQPSLDTSPHQETISSQDQYRGDQHEHSQRRRCSSSPPPPPPKPESGRECCGGSVGGFLKNLLPRDFDTGDLLIVLLLLLMSGDCAEEQNTALLTLVLYLFL